MHPTLLLLPLAFARSDMAIVRCYSCTTIDANTVLNDDETKWRRWLEDSGYVPTTVGCADSYINENNARSGVITRNCDAGVCMKVWFRGKSDESHVWRSCVPKHQTGIRSECTKISNSQGEMELCTCEGDLCNIADTVASSRLLQFFSWIIVFFILRRFN
ncbi:hypothetical protein AB6A40_005883 [Gnathostoma spinigerum]|uniref:UPAR/Ly6 domain-containing protein qvr n=1 Tax=Gnathostoma spinigerum TaxID=75299 RepID=A0ABD6EPE0_9BILA